MRYSYEEIISIIQNTRRFGNDTGYQVSKHMLERLGNPQSGIPFVHVAGTNGKGSTTAFLCSILEQTGKKIGMFTSPHLIDFEERIRINGVLIPREDVARLGNLLLETEFELTPTMFDYCLVMAVLYFKEQNCDLAVMETGIGGRFDSTNALGIPEVAIITKIGYDHMAVLGNTLGEIANEKAGIIKPGCPLVTQRQEPEAKAVLYENFLQTKQPMDNYICVTELDIERVKTYPMRMRGCFQLENAAAAMLAAELLFKKWEAAGEVFGQPSEHYIREGIARCFWKGRMELLNEQPFFLIDGAHNSHGVHALAESLRSLYPGEKFHFIMGVMADKDYEEMIEELLDLALDFVTVTPESNRALQARELADCIQKKGIRASYADRLEEAIKLQTGEKTIAFGSLYFIGAIERLWNS